MTQSTSRSWKHDFPCDMSDVSFAQNSIESSLKNKKERFYKNINLVVGGCRNARTGFYEILLSDKDNSISYKSFKNNYKKRNANLKKIGIDHGSFVQSFLLNNNKYLAVFHDRSGYNVYDMINDKWLLKKNNKNILGKKSILMTDEIIATYDYDYFEKSQLHFYYIGSYHLTNPLRIKTFDLSMKAAAGMCCTEFSKNEKDNKLMFKIILYGGSFLSSFLSSFLTFLSLSISISLDRNEIIIFGQQKIDKKMFKLKNVSMTKNEYYKYGWCSPGCECVFNEKNEAIVIFIGGILNGRRRSICLYNSVSDEMYFDHKVTCFILY